MGCALLVWSSNLFVDGQVGMVKWFKIPPILVGMVIVGFGTSMPDMLVSASAAYSGKPLLALGNAFGSSTTNILLILGVSTFLTRLVVHHQVYRRDLPILLGVTLLTLFLAIDGAWSRLDGVILLATFCILIFISVRDAMREHEQILARTKPKRRKPKRIDPRLMKPWKAAILMVIGLGLMVASSTLIVETAEFIATYLGVHDLVIGITIVAIGIALPELMSSITAIRRGETDLAIGNVIGSNFFNTLLVAGVAIVIHPVGREILPQELIVRDLGMVIGATILLSIAVFWGVVRTKLKHSPEVFIGKIAGAIFLLTYISYSAWLVIHEFSD